MADRKIKFRAWHVKNNEMVYFDNNKVSKDQFQSAAILRLMAGDDPGSLMQFTGFNDVNGNEIYEGDIVDEKYKWTVAFKDGSWFGISKFNQDLLYIIEAKREKAGIPLKIVGNIFES